jgi:RNA ligase
MACRGLVLDSQDRIVSRPFTKFFNLGEPSCPALPNEPYQVYEKLDGSLAIAFYHNGRWRMTTRGSFANDYVSYAERWLADFPFPKEHTVMFEVVIPNDAMSRPVKHDPGLYYLGSVHTESGMDLGPVDDGLWLQRSARCYGAESLDVLQARAENEVGHEGFVVRFESGLRVKIKTAWYLKLFRAITNLTEKKLRELVAETYDPEGVIASFPEELRAEVEQIVWPLVGRAQSTGGKIYREFSMLKKLYPEASSSREARKAFAFHIKEFPHRALFFKLLEGKEIMRDLILQE